VDAGALREVVYVKPAHRDIRADDRQAVAGPGLAAAQLDQWGAVIARLEKPSIRTGLVIAGRGEAGAMVWTPGRDVEVDRVAPPVAASESRMAWRSEPGPLSAVVVTEKIPSVMTD